MAVIIVSKFAKLFQNWFCPPAVGCIVLKELDDFEGRFDLWFYALTALLMMIYQIGTDEL